MTNLLSYAIIIGMMKREYEIISHAETNFKVFVVNLLYRAPHIHKDFELGLVLDGNISILLPGQTLLLQPGDFWLINPFQSHEIKADKPALLLSLQVSSAFFAPYYPEIDHLEFISCVLSASADMQYRTLFSDMTALASAIVRKAFFDNYTFQLIFDRNIKPSVEIQALLTVADIHNYMVVFCNKIATYTHELLFVNRLRKDCSPIVSEAISFIMSHYSRDIQIVDAADCLHISESRLMHAFKEETGKSFYAFLTEYRIYLAEIMMKNGRYKLYEISELVGYQNPLTFRRAFYRVTGSTPSKY